MFKTITKIATCLMLAAILRVSAQNDFITIWDLSISGSGATQLTFDVITTGKVTYSWETFPTATLTGNGTTTGSNFLKTNLPSNQKVKLKIAPTNFKAIAIKLGPDKDRLIDITQWGTTVWGSMKGAFWGCSNLTGNGASDTPNLSNVTDMSYIFADALLFNQSIGGWNTANVTTMNNLFNNCTAFNQSIGGWNTANVTNMQFMFAYASAYNQPLANWNTGKVKNMNGMFSSSLAFNQPIGNWNTSNVTDMSNMFLSTISFIQPIGNWNTANVTNMSGMFSGCTAFNQTIGGWDMGNVTDMSYMFSGCSTFNQPIGGWNTANIISMNGMFSNCKSFNQPIGNWNTTNATNMSNLFYDAATFNQSIGGWNTANVTNMSYTFSYATSFNQNVGSWNTANVTDMNNMFNGASSFNQTLAGWNTANVTDMNYMFVGASIFNHSIGAWITNNVTNMSGMFGNAHAFNQTIGGWNTGMVTDMSYMFFDAKLFNQSIGGWNTDKVTNMSNMFAYAKMFNQNIGTWNTSNVTVMSGMFNFASAFNQNIGGWGTKLNSTIDLSNFLDISGMNSANYDALLNGINTGTVTGRTMGAIGLIACSASAARNNLISTKNWIITDAGTVPGILIVTQPLSYTVCSGVVQPISVSATGSNLSYIWSNGLGTNTGVSTSIAGIYFVTVTGICGSVISNSASVVVNPLTSITSPPLSNATVCSGVAQVYSVSALGANLSYVWSDGQSNNNSMSTSVAGNYIVTVTGECGVVKSNAASLVVNPPTLIVTQPRNATFCVNDIALITVSATGSNLSYLWSFGSPLASFSGAASLSDNGIKYVTVTGTCGTVVSNGATITVNPLTMLLSNLPALTTICSGLTVPLNITASGANVSYLWSNGTSGSSTTISTSGTYFATVTGACGTILSNAAQVNLSDCLTDTTPGTSTITSFSQIVSTNNEIIIYPNPNSGSFTIMVDFSVLKSIGTESLNYIISTIDGKILAKDRLNVGRTNIETNLITGIYFVNVGGSVRKIFVE